MFLMGVSDLLDPQCQSGEVWFCPESPGKNPVLVETEHFSFSV